MLIDEQRMKNMNEIFRRLAKLERLTSADIFQPIVSLSTTDRKVVELLVGDRVMRGFFDSDRGCWMCNGGTDRMPGNLFPTHWRPLQPDATVEREYEPQMNPADDAEFGMKP